MDRLEDGDLVDAPEAAEVALVPQHDQLARAGEEAAEVADPSQLEVVIRLVDAQAVVVEIEDKLVKARSQLSEAQATLLGAPCQAFALCQKCLPA